MKHSRPHLLYLALIVAIGVFYWQRLKSDHQRIALLNRATDETMAAVRLHNDTLLKYIQKEANNYPSPKNDELVAQTWKADSLIHASYTDATLRDSLSSRLCMTGYCDEGVIRAYRTLLPSEKQAGFLSEHQNVLLQHDSLRRFWAYSLFLNICAEQMGRISTNCCYHTPMASYSVRCQPVGQSFETDIALCSYNASDMIRRLTANGQTLRIKEGVASFKHTYPAPGVYPLHVKAEIGNFESDSVRTSEKTFYLHVNH